MIDFNKLESSKTEVEPNYEIERKWIVNELPEGYKDWEHNEIRQGYIKGRNKCRIREEGNKYTKTIKSKVSADGSKRIEDEKEISKLRFTLLWFFTRKRRVYKTRYTKVIDGVKVELDIFHRKLDGHITVEVEFEDDESKDKYNGLPWFGKEVTSDERYKNGKLAKDGIPK